MLQQEGTGGETEWLPTPSVHLMVHKFLVLFGYAISHSIYSQLDTGHSQGNSSHFL